MGFDGSFGRMPGADDIVVYALDHVVFDHGHVLVSGGMIYGLDTERLQDLSDPVFVMHRTEQWHDFHAHIVAPGCMPKLAVDVVKGEFRNLEQQESPRIKLNDLPA